MVVISRPNLKITLGDRTAHLHIVDVAVLK